MLSHFATRNSSQKQIIMKSKKNNLPLSLHEPAIAYETKGHVRLNLPPEYIDTLSAGEIEDLSRCITGKELENRVISRLEKRLSARTCK